MKPFKLVSEANDSYHVQHSDGTTFTVNKKDLSPEAQKKLKTLRGGSPVQKLSDGGTSGDDEDDGTTEAPAPAASPAAATTGGSDGSPISVMQGYGAGQGAVLDQKAQALKAYMNQNAAANAKTQGAYDNVINQLQPDPDFAAPKPEEIQADMAKKDADFMQQLQQKGKDFNPNRYVQNMSTGSKIATFASMILNGAGSAHTGGRNLTADSLNNAINQDIDAQKSDYSNTANLYKMNHQAYQDKLQASLATKNQLLSVAQMQIAQQAANSNNAKSQLDAQNSLADIQAQKNQYNRAMGLLSKRTAGPDGTLPTDPTIVAAQLIQDPAQRTAALKEIEDNKELENARQFTMTNFNDLANKALGGKLSFADRKSAVAATSLKLAKSFNIKPGAAQDMVEEMMPGSGWTGLEGDTTTSNKRQRINQLFDMQKNSMGVLKSQTGLGPEDFSATATDHMVDKLNPLELKMYNIAKANPNHPDSIKFMKKYGANK